MIKLGLSLIADRYAKALFSLAKEQGEIDRVAADIQTLSGHYTQSEMFLEVAQNKMFSRIQQAKMLGALTDALGLHALAGQLVGVLAENRRLDIIPALAHAFVVLQSKERKITPVTVVSSAPVNGQQIQDITAVLEKSLGRKIVPVWDTDPAMLGGLMVRIGSTLFDCSLTGKLQRIEALSQEAIAA